MVDNQDNSKFEITFTCKKNLNTISNCKSAIRHMTRHTNREFSVDSDTWVLYMSSC